MSDSLSGRLCGACRLVWDLLPEHPFLQELAAGTLPLEKFRFYLEQNLLYLPEYARAMAIGAARSSTFSELRSFSAALTNIIETEIPENRALLDRVIEAGAADVWCESTPAPATLAYSGYLIAAAFGGGALDVMTVILPCAWSYGEIARQLTDRNAGHPIYSAWIEFFASDHYAELLGGMRREFDLLGTKERLDARMTARLEDTFRMGTRLELAFWRMAYELDHWPDMARLQS